MSQCSREKTGQSQQAGWGRITAVKAITVTDEALPVASCLPAQCLVPDTLTHVPAVMWCLCNSSSLVAHTAGEVPDAHPAHHTLGASLWVAKKEPTFGSPKRRQLLDHSSTFGSPPGLGALQLLLSALCQSIESGQKSLPSLGWSA